MHAFFGHFLAIFCNFQEIQESKISFWIQKDFKPKFEVKVRS